MAGERQSQAALPVDGEGQETILVDAYTPGADGVLAFHLRAVASLLAQGAPARAFGELVKASRAGPMTPRLAAALVRVGLKAGTEAAALTLLDETRETADGDLLVSIERQHIRLLRRAGQFDRAKKLLEGFRLLRPQDRRARRNSQWILQQEGKWDELDAALEEESLEAQRRVEWTHAASASLGRAKLHADHQNDSARATLRLAQAALMFEQGGLDAVAFRVRTRWFESLIANGATGQPLEDAARTLVRIATRANHLSEADALLERCELTREGRRRPKPNQAGAGDSHSAATEPLSGSSNGSGGTETPRAPSASTSAEPPASRNSSAGTESPRAPSASTSAEPLEPRHASAGAAAPRSSPAATEIELPAASSDGSTDAASGSAPLAPSPPTAASRAAPRIDSQRLRQLEAQYVARGAWTELAAFYRDRASGATSTADAAEVLTRLAELLENELDDASGAADVYGELVERTGDHHALVEQVRLLESSKGGEAVRSALEAAVRQAPGAGARIGAHLLRGRLALEAKDPRTAKNEFESVLAADPQRPEALLGQLEAAAKLKAAVPGADAHRALKALPISHPSRLAWIRRFARAVHEAELAEWAWSEVALAAPDEEEAQEELLAAIRQRGDDAALVTLLQRLLAREPRGFRARPRRRELWAALDRLGRGSEALQEIRLAARFEPGHREAWLALFDRLAERHEDEEAAWALEHAATSTEDEVDREAVWRQLGEFWRDVLGEDERAAVYFGRADAMRRDREITASEASATLGGAATEPSGQYRKRSALGEARIERSGQHRVLGEGRIQRSGVNAAISDAPAGRSGRHPAIADAPGGRSGRHPAIADAPAGRSGRHPAIADAPAGRSGKYPSLADAPGERSGTQPAIADAPGGRSGKYPSLADAPGERSGTQPAIVDGGRSGKQPASSPAAGRSASAPARASGKRKAVAGRAMELDAARSGSGPSVPWAEQDDPTDGRHPPALGEGPVSPSKQRPAPKPPQRPAFQDDEEELTSPSVGILPSTDRAAPASDDVPRRTEIELPVVSEAKRSTQKPAPPPSDNDPLEVTSGDFVVPESAAIGPSAAAKAAATRAQRSEARQRLFDLVRTRPLESDGYRALEEAFRASKDGDRAELMKEIAESLDGRGPMGEQPPRLMLSATDRAGLRHPSLRDGPGELLTLVGHALCRLFPAKGRQAGSREEFRIDAGRGAREAADALLAAVRILGLRAPDVYLSEDNGPPFSMVWTQGPRLLVGRTAVNYPLAPAELRFFAGRALFTQTPDLMVLRALRKDQLYHALDVLGKALKSERGGSPEVKLVRGALPAKSLERISSLYEACAPNLRYGHLADAARHSANRAGLSVSGAVAPALDALRAKKALAREMEELIRFAASERHFQLRARWTTGN